MNEWMPLPFTCFTSTFCILLVIIDLQSRAFCVSSLHGMHIRKYWFLQILVIWMCICSLRSHHINQLTYTSFWSQYMNIILDCIGLHWIALDCIGLHWIALHFEIALKSIEFDSLLFHLSAPNSFSSLKC